MIWGAFRGDRSQSVLRTQIWTNPGQTSIGLRVRVKSGGRRKGLAGMGKVGCDAAMNL